VIGLSFSRARCAFSFASASRNECRIEEEEKGCGFFPGSGVGV